MTTERVTLGADLDHPVVLGGPEPVITVPITAQTLDGVREQWQDAVEAGADLVEWRLDYLEGLENLLPEVHDVADQCRRQWGIPVLATIRTAAEGGNFDQMDAYLAFTSFLSEWADAVDVEVDRLGSRDLIAEMKTKVPVVASFHQYAHAPNAPLIKGLLSRMADTSAHVVKIAWMTSDADDVIQVSDAAAWAAENIAVPAVVIGMGEAGVTTRLGQAAQQAAFAFATAGDASAPGQPTVAELKESVSQRRG